MEVACFRLPCIDFDEIKTNESGCMQQTSLSLLDLPKYLSSTLGLHQAPKPKKIHPSAYLLGAEILPPSL